MDLTPTTVTQVLLLIILLLPGIAYTGIRGRRTPERRRSLFRESVEVVTVGILADTFALIVFAIADATGLGTPDVPSLIRQGQDYVADTYGLVAVWFFGLTALAVGVAAAAAWWFMPNRPHVSGMSAWWRLFQDRPREIKDEHDYKPRIMVSCHLDDGTFVSGELHTHNRMLLWMSSGWSQR